MKTRIVHTRIWQDDFYADLSSEEKLLFLYFLTNDQVNIIHCYEITDRKILFDTGVTKESLEAAKTKFSAADKIHFYKSFIYLKNANRYEKYEGEDNQTAKKKLVSQLSSDVYNWLFSHKDTPLSQGSNTQPTGTINHKSEIINKKSETIKNTLTENVENQLQKIEGIVKPKYNPVKTAIVAILLLALPLLFPVETYAKTLRIKISLRAGLVKNQAKSTVPRQPRPLLAENKEPAAIYSQQPNDSLPEAHMTILNEIKRYAWSWNTAFAVARSESGLRADAQGWNCWYEKSTGTVSETGSWTTHYSGACKSEERPLAWSVDCGIFQLNFPGKVCPAESFNAEWNIQKAYEWKYAPSQTFKAWVAYTNGNYKAFIN